MTDKTVTATDLVRSLPGILRRIPSIAKGFY